MPCHSFQFFSRPLYDYDVIIMPRCYAALILNEIKQDKSKLHQVSLHWRSQDFSTGGGGGGGASGEGAKRPSGGLGEWEGATPLPRKGNFFNSGMKTAFSCTLKAIIKEVGYSGAASICQRGPKRLSGGRGVFPPTVGRFLKFGSENGILFHIQNHY